MRKAWLVALAASAAACVHPHSGTPVGGTLPGGVPQTLVAARTYTAVSPGTKASQFWCGNLWKGRNVPAGTCTSSTGRSDAVVIENAEIRGWLVAVASHYQEDFNEEFAMDILLDVGWHTDAPGVRAISTVDDVSQVLTPLNVRDLGVIASTDLRHPDPIVWDHWTSVPFDSSGGAVVGGLGAPVVHIEINGWGPCRVCGACPQPSCTRHIGCKWPPACAEYYANRPKDWIFISTASTKYFPIYFPFDPMQFHAGDYVRMVGTLWEDGAHIDDPSDHMGKCWVGGISPGSGGGDTRGRGRLEMHPVDFMEKIDPPPQQTHTLAAYAGCAGHETLTLPWQTVVPPTPPPGARYLLNYKERINGAFTNWTSLQGSYAGADACGRVKLRDDHVDVGFQVNGDNSHRGLFFGFYDVYWDTAAPLGCSLDVNPRVFDWQYYLGRYADLRAAGIADEAAAQRHWLAFGINEGRRAHPTFSSVDYLNLYPDLKVAFGSDYHKAIEHYLVHGIFEGRVGVDCRPTCSGRVCGVDGCGVSCGSCAAGQICSGSQCTACVPHCAGRSCGDDGCGGSCGSCSGSQLCSDGRCAACQPQCDGKTCGDDGCGGSCGTCAHGLACDSDTSTCSRPCPNDQPLCDCVIPPACLSSAACKKACRSH